MKHQINALTSTRAFAAIMVFIFHCGRNIYPFDKLPSIFRNGNLAVSYFFVLSGFVLYISYVHNDIRYLNFIKKRIARIGPAYWLALGLFVIAYLYVYKNSYTPDVTWQIIYSALFIQGYFPHYALCLNTAAWSLSAEMLFYLSFPFLLLLEKKNLRFFLLLTALCYIITQVCMYLFFKRDWLQTDNWTFFLFNPVMHINQFLIGMAGGCLFKKIKPTQKKYSFLPVALLGVILLLIAIKPDTLDYNTGLIAPVFILFIVAVAINDPKFLNIRPLVFLGEISYGIYILQFPITVFAHGINEQYKLFGEYGYFYFSFAMLLAAATVSYYLIEKPLRKKIIGVGLNRESRRTQKLH